MPTIPRYRRPTTPAEILVKDFLEPLAIAPNAFAQRLGLSSACFDDIIHGRAPVTADTALRLARVLGMSAEFWLNAQLVLDLYDAMHSASASDIAALEPIPDLRSAS
ncbi:MAG: family transcriptional regulator [Candidatus Eremiobacteraeota bacterium]|nr:family transcriptional regulator [Candidatus Eremiobacteraeota bacterium]